MIKHLIDISIDTVVSVSEISSLFLASVADQTSVKNYEDRVSCEEVQMIRLESFDPPTNYFTPKKPVNNLT